MPFALQLRGYFGQLVVITADQHNTCAFLGKTFGGRFADSGTGTCDDDDFLGETIHSAVSKMNGITGWTAHPPAAFTRI